MAAGNYYGDGKDTTIVNTTFTGKAQVIDLTNPEVLDPAQSGQVVSGDIADAKNATITGGRDVIGGGSKATEASYTLGNDTIVGDAQNLTGTAFTGGADKITLNGIDHASATVIGDAQSISHGSFRGGNDTLIVAGNINGGVIIGDVESVTNTTFTAGNDIIQLKGNVSNAEIYTDAKTLTGVNTLLGGNDSITLGIAPTKANPTVNTTIENTTINLGHGNDNLTAHSTLGEGTHIDGEDGNDRFTIANMTAGSISGGAGNDSFSVTATSGTIYGDAGNDTFTIGDFTDGGNYNALRGGEGNDKITVTTVTNATIYGDAGNDSISVTTITGNIHGSAGNDSITVKDFTGSTGNDALWGGDGNDKITVTTATNVHIGGDTGDDTITVTENLNGGSIEGLGDNDSIKVTNASKDANIRGNIGDDTITVTKTLDGSALRGDSGNDSIKVADANNKALIEGGDGDDTIAVTNITDSTVSGGEDADSINITKTATNAEISGDDGNDSISVITATDSKIYGDDDSGSVTGDDSIKIVTANTSLIDGGAGTDSITITNLLGDGLNGHVDGGTEDDNILITTMTNAIITDAGGSDSVKITTLKGEDNNINLGDGNDTLTINNFTANKANIVSENALNMGAGDDSLNILAKNTNYSDTDFVDALGTGNDTLNVNWAFDGIFNTSSSSDGKTLITKGLGANANLNFGSGDDALIMTSSSNKSIHQGDSGLADVVNANGGNDTLSVNWAFNGDYWTGNDGGTLITKGLNANSTLDFGDGDDGLILTGTLANRTIFTDIGDDTISISSTATNVQVDLGTSDDVFSVGAMGKNSTLTYNNDGYDSITIKGTYNSGMVVDGIGEATALSTGTDGGSITLDTLGTGQLAFGDGTDNLTINRNIAGTATVKKEINTLGGNDSIDLKGTVTNTIVHAGTGSDTVSIGALSTGALVTYDADGQDSITLKGTYNTGTTQTSVDISNFHGLATGDDSGSITLDTLGTGKLEFGGGSDTLTINKALSGSLGLKDIFMQGGHDVVVLNTVNGAVISGGDGIDTISATGLGATGVLNGDAGGDVIRIGRSGLDTVARPATATMNNGIIDGGEDDDRITIGNTYADGKIYGSLSGGKVYGGSGNDGIETNTLSGTGLIDGGDGIDTIELFNMSGGTINGGDSKDVVYINNIFSRGTINGDAGEEYISVETMSGGTINGGADNDVIFIENLKGGVIHGDAGEDNIRAETMTGGTINSGAGDTINITSMSGGVINDSDEASGTFSITDISNGTINTNAGNDTVGIASMSGGAVNGGAGHDTVTVTTLSGGTVNGGDGNDSVSVTTISGGTIHTGEGNNSISISDSLNGGKILAGKGDDTLTLEDGITLGSGYSIDLGDGYNDIIVKSNLDGQKLSLGASDDQLYVDNTGTQFINASINLGAGDDRLDRFSGSTNAKLMDTLLDAGSGDDTLYFNEIDDSIVLGGTGNDEIVIQGATDNAIIDADSGNNSIYFYGSSLTSTNVSIVSGSGNDEVSISQALNAGSSINVGTGSDAIDIHNSLLNADGSVGATISYDTKGQDSISLQEYHAGMVIDSKGETTALSTGSDGGSITIDSWISGDISFGNGNDSFTLNDNLVKSINLGSGADSVYVKALQGDGTIIYTNSGFDTIEIGGAYNGSGIYQSLDKDGKGVGTLSTGSDGGQIELGSWTGGIITLGNGNDAVSINSGTIANNLDFMKGNDTIDIAELSQNNTITYDNTGKDAIILDEYAGFGIEAQDGKLSTGANGGTIELNTITEAGVLNLSFSDSNDEFVIDDLTIVDDASIEGTNTTIDLKKGADTIEINDMGASGTIKYNVDGVDSIYIGDTYSGTGVYGYSLNKDDSENNLGLATGDDGGYIEIQGIDADGAKNISFGKGADTLEVGRDGVNIGGESIDLGLGNDKVLLGYSNLSTGTIDAGDGNNTIEIDSVEANGTVLAGSGADTIHINYEMQGNINAGNGNNKITLDDTVSGSISTGTGADTITINRDWQDNATNLSGSINAGLGNDSMNLLAVSGAVYGDVNTMTATTNFTAGVDRITADSLSGTAKMYGDANSITATDKLNIKGGNDIITVNGDISGTDADNVVSIFGDMESVTTAKTFTAGNDNITLKGNVEFTEMYTDAKTVTSITTPLAGGNDSLTLGVKGQEGQTSISNTSINLGHGNDAVTAYSTLGSNTTIHAGDGNDRLTISDITAGTLNGDAGNDSFNIITMTGGTANGGAGNDIFDIEALSGSAIANGDAGNDIFDITTMAGGTIDGGASNDTFTLKNLELGTAMGDAGNDKFTIITMTGGTVYGDDTANMLKGNDTISVTTATGGTIVGGEAIETQNSKGVSSFGVDSIVVKNATNLTILGDYGVDTIVEKVDDNTVSYNDIIKVTGIAENTTIDGSYGNDNITIATMNDGSASGGTGNDTISVTTSRNGEISGGSGDDKITVTTGIGDEVSGGFSINGGGGSDTITMTTLNRGTIEGSLDSDSITVKNAYASSIYGDENGGSDTTAYNDVIKVTGLAEDTDIFGGFGDDAITVGTVTNGSYIDGNAGNDTISATSVTNSTISGGADDDSITAKTVTSSQIYGDAGADSITLTTVNYSGISGGDGDDTIKVTTLNGSSIDGGAGKDSITVTNQIRSEVIFSNSADIDEIYLQGGIGAGAVVNLQGAGGFIVDRDGTSLSNSVFNMSGGELHGSEGQDYLYLGTFSGGEINGNDEADDINIKTMSGGIVDGGAGNDSLIVNTNMTNGIIRGGAGNDSIDVKISGASKGILDGGDGADTFVINATKNSSITIQEFEATDILTINSEDATAKANEALADGKQSFDFITTENVKVTVNFATVREQGDVTEINITNKTIYGTDTIDTFNISGTATNSKIYALADDDSITVGTLTNSEIYGEAGADDITITTVNGGYIDGGYDDDVISIENQVKKSITIANEDGADTLYLENGIGSGGNVTLEDPGFVVAQGFDTATSKYTGFNVSGGTLTGSESVETIHINTLSSGTLNTSSGVDTIHIASMTGGTITTTDASATINIDAAITKTISLNNFGVGADSLNLANGLNGGTIKLGGDGGFDIGRAARFDMLKGTITGSAGRENVFINTMTTGTINGGDGNDSIDIITMQAGSINAGAGIDSITIKTLASGTIDGGAGLDYINIFDTISSKVSFKNTGTEQDNINLANIVTGANITLTSNAGFRVQADTMTAGQITASAGADDLLLSKMEAGKISLGAGNDSIHVGNMDGGIIDAGSGNDTVSLNEVNGTINGGSGFDMLQYSGTVSGNIVDLKGSTTGFEAYAFWNMESGGSINGTDGADNISILYDMGGGTLHGNAGNDTLSVLTMISGNVNGGAGNDVLEIATMYNGTLDGGAGLDSITIENYVSTEVNITNTGTEVDVVTLNTGISSGGIVNLTGDNAFEVHITDIRDTDVSDAVDGGILNASGANDTINITTLNDGTVNGNAGDDSIYILSATGGTIDGGAGNDTMSLSTMSGGTIQSGAGDDSTIIKNIVTEEITIENAGGYDTVSFIEGVGAGAIINLSATTESIIVRGGVNTAGFNMSGGTINASDAVEGFYLENMTGGTINAAGGNDRLSVITMSNGNINGDAGRDTFDIANLKGGILDGGADVDTFEISGQIVNAATIKNSGTEVDDIYLESGIGNGAHVTLDSDNGFVIAKDYDGNDNKYFGFDMSGGTLTGGAGADTFHVDNMAGGTVDGDENTDTFNINTMTDGTVNAGADDDTIDITTMTGGELQSEAGNDSITIGTMEGGSITNTAGGDSITITNLKDGTLNGGSDAETYHITNMSGATISGGAGADTFTIASMTGGTINGGDDIDTFNMTNMSGGSVNGGEGEDIFNIETMSGGTINGGDGEDIFDITTELSGEVRFINNDAEQDSINVADNITQTGAHIILEGSGGSELLFSGSNDLKAVRITGSAGNDHIRPGSIVETSINAGDGDDTVSLGIMEDNSAIYGGNGNDSIVLTITSDSVINGGDGNDTININTSSNSGSTTDGGTGDDLITINYYYGGIIDGGIGNDTVSVENVKNNISIHNSGGQDTLILTNGLVDSDSREYTLTLEDENITLESSAGVAYVHTGGTIAMGEELINLELGTVDGGNVTGNALDNKITITTMTDGTIDAGAGDDYVTIDSINGTIKGGDGEDTLHITSPVDGEISAEDILSQVQGFEHVVFGEVTTNGKVSGTDEADSIGVITMTDGLVSTLAGNDAISISNFNGGSIDGGAGQDSVFIENTLANGVNINNDNDEADHIFLESGLSDGAVLTLSGNGQYMVAGSQGTEGSLTGFTMSGGTINGGGGREEYHITTLSGGTINADTIGVQSYVPVPSDGWEENPHGFNAYTHATYGDLQLDDNGQYFYTPASTITTATNFSIPYTITYTDGSVYDNGNLTINVDPADLSTQFGTVEGFPAYEDEIYIDTMVDGTVNAGDAGDGITINTMQGGIVDGGKGWDHIKINNQIIHEVTFKNSSDNSGFEADELFLVNGIGSGGIVNLDTTEGFVVSKSFADDPNDHIGFTMSGGMINGSSASDVVYIDRFSGGTVNGANGSDIINIATAQGGTIDSGAGADSLYISNEVTAGLTVNNGMDTIDHVFLENGIGNGANISLGGKNGFIVAADYGSDINDYVGFNMSGGTLNATSFNDTVYVNTLSAGNIDLSGGQDTITITTMTNGDVKGGDGSDSITITNMDGGTVDAGYSGDIISITNFNGGTVYTGDSTENENDTVVVENQITKAVTFKHGYYTVDIFLEGGVGAGANITLEKDGVTTFNILQTIGSNAGFDMSGGTINGSADTDNFVINSMTGGTINAHGDNDTVTIESMSAKSVINLGAGNDKANIQDLTLAGSLDGGDGRDTLSLDSSLSEAFDFANMGANFKNFEVVEFINLEDAVNVTGTNTDDGINIRGEMRGGSIDMGGGNDSVGVTYFENGVINGGDGNDTLSVGDVHSMVNGDAGHDTVLFFAMKDGSIHGGAGNDTIGHISSSELQHGNIYGDEGDDEINVILVDSTRASIISGGAGDDAINILADGNGANILSFVRVYGDAGQDTFSFTTLQDTRNVHLVGFNALEDTLMVDGVDRTDEVSAGNKIWGEDGKVLRITFFDEVRLSEEVTTAYTYENTTVNQLYLNFDGGVGSGADISVSGAGGFVLSSSHSLGFDMTGAKLTSSEGNDRIFLDSIHDSTIDVSAGRDTIYIEELSGNVTFINNGSQRDSIDDYAAHILSGASITLQGTGGFYVSITGYEENTSLSGSEGADSISVYSSLHAVTFSGNGGNDSFYFDSLDTNSKIYGGEGDDSIKIGNSIGSGTIWGGAGNDTIEAGIKSDTDAILDGGAGADSFVITSFEASQINIQGFDINEDKLNVGGVDVTAQITDSEQTWGDITINFIGDRINIDDEVTSALSYTNNTLGADTISLHGGVGTGADITLEGTGGFVMTNVIYSPFGFNMTDGEINGSEGADKFVMNSMSGGTINTGAGADTISIAQKVTLDQDIDITLNSTGDGKDIILFTGGVDCDSSYIYIYGSSGAIVAASYEDSNNYTGFNLISGGIYGADGEDVFYVNTMSSGTLMGWAGTDEFHVTTMDGGSLHSGPLTGNVDGDLFSVETMNAGFITGFDGNDTVNVTSMNGGSIRTGAGDDSITVNINATSSGRLDGGEGADTFTITSSQEAGVEITGFNTGEDTLFVNGADVTTEVTGTEHTWGDITIYFTS